MKIYRCQFCNFSVSNINKNDIRSAKNKMGHHYQTEHLTLIPPDMGGYRWFYYLLTKKDKGSCIVCKGETDFNETAMKYSRFCNNKGCKLKYREEFKNRMIKKYGKIHLLNDPNKQKEMLANRRISGVYNWSDKSAEFGYTGTYELDFLKFLDLNLKWKSSDILAPSPHIYSYEYEGKDHFYIPDFFIPSNNCEIEIKSSIMTERVNPDSKAKDRVKDELMRSNSTFFNYCIIYDKNYDEFINLIKEI
jgi:hypothetical protein